jgi:hypothetical protein
MASTGLGTSASSPTLTASAWISSEREHDVRLVLVGVQHHRSAGLVVHLSCVALDQQLVDDRDREVLPEETHVCGVVSKPHLPHRRMNPVAAEHQVERTSGAPGERGLDLVARFRQVRDAVAKDDLDAVFHAVEQHLHEHGPLDLELIVRRGLALVSDHQRALRDITFVLEIPPSQIHSLRSNLVEEPHAPDDIDGVAFDVDGRATFTNAARAL